MVLRYYVRHSQSSLFIEGKGPAIYLDAMRYRGGEVIFESRCNSLGYFDEQEFVEEKASGLKRVLVISDSFGCAMVPCRYHAFTKAEKLDGEGPRWEIFNLSVNAAGPEEYLYLLKSEGLAFNPDFFLLGFFAGNDLSLSMSKPVAMLSEFEKKTRPASRLSDKIMLIKFLGKIYKTYQIYKMYKAGLLGEKAIRVFAEDPLGKHLVDWKRENAATTSVMSSPDQKSVNIHPEEWWMKRKIVPFVLPEDGNTAAAINAYTDVEIVYFEWNLIETDSFIYSQLKDIFKEMKKLMGRKIVVVLFPDAYQIDDEIYNRILLNARKRSHESFRKAHRHAVYNNVKELLKQENIPVIDLLEPFQKGRKTYGRLYFLNDTHLNYWGNHIAALEIRKFLAAYFAAEEDTEDNTL